MNKPLGSQLCRNSCDSDMNQARAAFFEVFRAITYGPVLLNGRQQHGNGIRERYAALL